MKKNFENNTLLQIFFSGTVFAGFLGLISICLYFFKDDPKAIEITTMAATSSSAKDHLGIFLKFLGR